LKRSQIQCIKDHVDERQGSIHQLRDMVAMLIHKSAAESDEVAPLRELAESVDDMRKRARNSGEDLVEYMLALDKLAGLTSEDRTLRKAAIGTIERLLDEVDEAKSSLSTFHRTVEAKLKEAREESAHQDAEKRTSPQEQGHSSVTQHPNAPEKKQEQEPPVRGSQDIPAPGHEFWQNIQLPARFNAREEPNNFLIAGKLPRLDTKNLKLALNSDNTVLTIEGICIPTDDEAAHMQRQVATHLHQLAKRSPGRFRQLLCRIDEVVANAYAELGQGSFGRFSESFRVPREVDIREIRASHQDSVLCVKLPKKARTVAPMPDRVYRAPRSSRGHVATPYGGMPMFGNMW